MIAESYKQQSALSQYVDNALYCLLFPKLLLPASQGSNYKLPEINWDDAVDLGMFFSYTVPSDGMIIFSGGTLGGRLISIEINGISQWVSYNNNSLGAGGGAFYLVNKSNIVKTRYSSTPEYNVNTGSHGGNFTFIPFK